MSLIDLHCDTFWQIDMHPEKHLYENDLCVDVKKLQAAGSMAQFFACFIHTNDENGNRYMGSYERALRMIARANEEFARNQETIGLARNYEELMRQKEAGKIAAFLTIEEGGILEGCMDRLEALYAKGIRLMTLLWNHENCMGYPNSREKRVMAKGLKPFGLEVAERMQELGMLIDVSHLSDGGFWDIARHCRKPFVASHSNARALCDHPRNLSDEMIKAIADAGGVAGVNFYPYFVTKYGVATAEDIAGHVCHMMDIGGEDVVSVGTDFDGYDEGELDMEHMGEMGRFYNALEKRGLTQRQIDKICHGNALRVIKEVL